MLLNPEEIYLHLEPDGAARPVIGGATFWALPAAEMAQYDHGWLITEFVCDTDWSNWERHPEGDELVYLLDGDVEIHQELSSGLATTRIRERGAVLIARNVWHTASVFAPSRMLFVTAGRGTEHRLREQV